MILDGKDLNIGDKIYHFWRGDGFIVSINGTSATAEFNGNLLTFDSDGKINGIKLVGIGRPILIWPNGRETNADMIALNPIIDLIRNYAK